MTEHPWIKSYPPNVRWDADIPLMPVQQILEDAASKWPNNPAIDFMGRKISYSELNELANRAAKGFQELGVRLAVLDGEDVGIEGSDGVEEILEFGVTEVRVDLGRVLDT